MVSRDGSAPGFFRSWFGPAVLAAGFLVVLGAMLWLTRSRLAGLREAELLSDAQHAAEAIRLDLDGERHYLLLLAEDMSLGALDERIFQERASHFVADHASLINIAWADDDFIIRWTAPYEQNKQIIGLKLALPEPERASHEAQETGQPVYTEPFEVIQGSPAFEVYVPVFRDGLFLGTFAGVYPLENVLRHSVPATVRERRHVALAGPSGAVIAELSPTAETNDAGARRIAIDPPGHGLSLVVSGYRDGLPWGPALLGLLCVGLAIGMLWGIVALRRELSLRAQAESELRGSREQLRALTARLQDVLEEERTVLARTFHDDIGATLAAVKMDLSWIMRRAVERFGEADTAAMAERVEATSALLDAGINSVRETGAELRPGVLDDFGLVAAIEWLAGWFGTHSGIECRFSCLADTYEMDPGRATALFRICQELLTNVWRHSGATEVQVDLAETADGLCLEVSDNGKGTAEEDVSSPEALSILGIRERARLLGATVDIAGSPSEGTTVRVRVPKGQAH